LGPLRSNQSVFSCTRLSIAAIAAALSVTPSDSKPKPSKAQKLWNRLLFPWREPGKVHMVRWSGLTSYQPGPQFGQRECAGSGRLHDSILQNGTVRS
jgi:hypothetical protein